MANNKCVQDDANRPCISVKAVSMTPFAVSNNSEEGPDRKSHCGLLANGGRYMARVDPSRFPDLSDRDVSQTERD